MDEMTINFDTLIVFIVIGAWIFSIIFNIKKNNKLKKLKAGNIASKELKWVVSSIEYGTNKNDSTILSWYFFAKAIDPKTQKEEDFKSENFPYKNNKFKFRIFWPNEEDKKKFFEYTRNIVKEWDIVKIHISEEDPELYYIEDTYIKSNKSLETNMIIKNKQVMEDSSNNIWWVDKNWKLSPKLKKKTIIILVAVFLISLGASFNLLKSDNQNSTNLIKLILPKFDWWININRWWSYVVRIILVLIIAFIIYKVVIWYRWPKK